MSETLKRIEELERQRVTLNEDIDREIEGLQHKALQELVALKSQLAGLESILRAKPGACVSVAPVAQVQPTDPWAETDAGRVGGGGAAREDGVSIDEFKDELAELRERGLAKRRRIA